LLKELGEPSRSFPPFDPAKVSRSLEQEIRAAIARPECGKRAAIRVATDEA